LLLDLQNARIDRVHKDDVATGVARERDDRLDQSLLVKSATGKLTQLENGIVKLPVACAANCARLFNAILKMVLEVLDLLWA
jgi:hypothetical protein